MEKKKLLLVAVSVGVVLFIIISIPLLIISPRENPAAVSQAVAPSRVVVESTIEAPVLTPSSDNALVIQPSSVVADVTTIEPPVRVNTTPPVSEPNSSKPVETPQVTTITVEAPHTVAVPSAPAPRTQRSTATTAAARPAATVARAPERSAERTTSASPQETTRPAAAKPAAEKASNNSFWVQTGAFSTQGRAEGAKESLASKGITSVIDNRDIDGKTWYRVRVGPYVTETEANYWLALVKTIDGFADSQVRQAPAALR